MNSGQLHSSSHTFFFTLNPPPQKKKSPLFVLQWHAGGQTDSILNLNCCFLPFGDGCYFVHFIS